MPREFLVNPALQNYEDEAAIIGLLVVGYGELDIGIVAAVGRAIGYQLELLDALDAVNSEMARLDFLAKIAANKMTALGLRNEFDQCLQAIQECRAFRNWFAHCHFGDFGDGLVAVKGKDLFLNSSGSSDTLPWRRLTMHSLTQVARHFEYARRCSLWLEHAITERLAGRSDFLAKVAVQNQPARDAGPWRPGGKS